jgi:hypothetical protein
MRHATQPQRDQPERPRLARLRPEFAHHYPGITPDTWLLASVMVDQVWAVRLTRGNAGALFRDRALPPEHFEFRYGTTRVEQSSHPWQRSTDRGELFG